MNVQADLQRSFENFSGQVSERILHDAETKTLRIKDAMKQFDEESQIHRTVAEEMMRDYWDTYFDDLMFSEELLQTKLDEHIAAKRVEFEKNLREKIKNEKLGMIVGNIVVQYGMIPFYITCVVGLPSVIFGLLLMTSKGMIPKILGGGIIASIAVVMIVTRFAAKMFTKKK